MLGKNKVNFNFTTDPRDNHSMRIEITSPDWHRPGFNFPSKITLRLGKPKATDDSGKDVPLFKFVQLILFLYTFTILQKNYQRVAINPAQAEAYSRLSVSSNVIWNLVLLAICGQFMSTKMSMWEALTFQLLHFVYYMFSAFLFMVVWRA